MSNQRGTLYTGITVISSSGYTSKTPYDKRLRHKIQYPQPVYFETTDVISAALSREKQIKGLLRNKSLNLSRA
jgi:predicted GIY-YIG superfamily endonuclease